MRTARTVLALAASGAALVSLAACGTPKPSAQCRWQLRQVAAYQADAENIQASSVAVANGQLLRFNTDVDTSGRLLKRMHAEGCPDKGY